MYFLPIYITKYKANVKADCFVQYIRSHTMYKYDQDGYVKQSNPRGLICRNEKDKTIILKDRPFYLSHSGGTTAIMIADSDTADEITITVIAYHDWAGSIWNVLFIFGAVYSLISGDNPLFALGIIAFVIFMNSLDAKELKRQKELIEKGIAECEQRML